MFCTWVAESSQRRPGPWTSGKKHRMLPFHACPSTCGQSWTSPFAPSTRTTCTFELDWGPHAVECEQDPSVKDVLMLLHERSHELSAQIVLLLQSFWVLKGPKCFTQKRQSLPPGQSDNKRKEQIKGQSKNDFCEELGCDVIWKNARRTVLQWASFRHQVN